MKKKIQKKGKSKEKDVSIGAPFAMYNCMKQNGDIINGDTFIYKRINSM